MTIRGCRLAASLHYYMYGEQEFLEELFLKGNKLRFFGFIIELP